MLLAVVDSYLCSQLWKKFIFVIPFRPHENIAFMTRKLLQKLFSTTALILVLTTTASAQFQYIGTYQSGSGVPNYLVNPNDVIAQSFINRIDVTLPEYLRVPVFNPQYLVNTPTNLDITAAADVWITYISEGASFRNALGYYTFPTNNPPLTPPAQSAIKILLPNASTLNMGGGLVSGNKVYLGQFPAGTSIGWVLVSDGWDGTEVTSGNFSLYSTPSFNPEVDASKRRHNVMLLDSATNRLVIGFEDNNRENPACDEDFNDLVFYATVTPFTNVDTTNVPFLNDTTGTSGGGSGGGLESESLGGIVNKIAFNKLKAGTPEFNPATAPLFATMLSASRSYAESLSGFMPASLEGGYTAIVSTPDITSYTNAKEVVGIDYTKAGKTYATALGIKTFGRAYNHTKSICDRFRGAQIISLDSMKLGEYSFIRFILRQPNGSIEYAFSFVAGVKTGRAGFSLQTNWLLSDLQREDTMYNFQVWSTIPTDAVKLLYTVINNLKASRTVQQINMWQMPKAIITQGVRKKDKLLLYITNLSNTTNASVRFDERKSETSTVTDLSIPFTLNQTKGNVVAIDIKDGYEYEGGLQLNGETQDLVYLTDGGWGIDKDNAYTTINKYEVINNPSRIYKDDEYPLYRTSIIKATTKDYITAFKTVQASAAPKDLSAYKTLQFYAVGNVAVEIKITKKGITAWADQYKKTIQLDPAGRIYKISLEDFYSDKYKDPIKADDVVTISFGYLGGREVKDVNMTFGDISFTKESLVSDRSLQSKDINIYPNPSDGRFNCSFTTDEDGEFVLQVADNVGRTLYTKTINAVRGVNTVSVELNQKITTPIVGSIIIRNGKEKYNPKQIFFK